jgi:phosphoglycolate phosphatase-like HAD superfamily hydrolase
MTPTPTNTQTIYVDVDDTLIRSIGPKRIPIPAVIDHVRLLKSAGHDLYCWSTGGAAYARETAEQLGIAHCFTAFLPKPNVILDDQPVFDWRSCTHLHPANCA